MTHNWLKGRIRYSVALKMDGVSSDMSRFLSNSTINSSWIHPWHKIRIPVNEYIQFSIKEHVRRLLWK